MSSVFIEVLRLARLAYICSDRSTILRAAIDGTQETQRAGGALGVWKSSDALSSEQKRTLAEMAGPRIGYSLRLDRGASSLDACSGPSGTVVHA